VELGARAEVVLRVREEVVRAQAQQVAAANAPVAEVLRARTGGREGEEHVFVKMNASNARASEMMRRTHRDGVRLPHQLLQELALGVHHLVRGAGLRDWGGRQK
jgi:hypothetical protein